MELALKKSFNKWIKIDEDTEFKVDYPTVDQEIKLQNYMIDFSVDETVRQYNYARYYIRCTVKDWRGAKVKDIPFSLIKNEMQKDLWWSVVKDPLQAMDLFTLISTEMKFDTTDKKKSN